MPTVTISTSTKLSAIHRRHCASAWGCAATRFTDDRDVPGRTASANPTSSKTSRLMCSSSPVDSSSIVEATPPPTEFSSGTNAASASPLPNRVERGRHAAARLQFGVGGSGNRAQRRFGERAFGPQVGIATRRQSAGMGRTLLRRSGSSGRSIERSRSTIIDSSSPDKIDGASLRHNDQAWTAVGWRPAGPASARIAKAIAWRSSGESCWSLVPALTPFAYDARFGAAVNRADHQPVAGVIEQRGRERHAAAHVAKRVVAHDRDVAKRVGDVEPQVVHAAARPRTVRPAAGRSARPARAAADEERLAVVAGLQDRQLATQPAQPQVREERDEQAEATAPTSRSRQAGRRSNWRATRRSG